MHTAGGEAEAVVARVVGRHGGEVGLIGHEYVGGGRLEAAGDVGEQCVDSLGGGIGEYGGRAAGGGECVLEIHSIKR